MPQRSALSVSRPGCVSGHGNREGVAHGAEGTPASGEPPLESARGERRDAHTSRRREARGGREERRRRGGCERRGGERGATGVGRAFGVVSA